MRHFTHNIVRIKTEDGKEWVGLPALQGKNLYETAVEYGFKGTPEDWVKNLIEAARVDLSNVSMAHFIEFGEKAGFQTSSVKAWNTVFNGDGSVTETSTSGDVRKTTFNDDGSITEEYTLITGEHVTKTIVFNNDGTITETLT